MCASWPWRQRLPQPDLLLAGCKYTCRPAKQDCLPSPPSSHLSLPSQHERNWESNSLPVTAPASFPRLPAPARWQVVDCAAASLWVGPLASLCSPLSGMPRSWVAGSCTTPGRRNPRRYGMSGDGDCLSELICLLPALDCCSPNRRSLYN
jgi:hypothetical protein